MSKAKTVTLRPVERDYMAVLGDAITLDVWRAIVGKALDLAKEGEPKAREWVTRLVLVAVFPRCNWPRDRRTAIYRAGVLP
jgi:hypothetical protein